MWICCMSESLIVECSEKPYKTISIRRRIRILLIQKAQKINVLFVYLKVKC